MTTEPTPFQKVTDDLTEGCGCACHTGIGYRSSCEHCPPLRFETADDASRYLASEYVKTMWNERERFRLALEEIAEGWHTHPKDDPPCRDGQRRENWCDGCVAADALERGQEESPRE